jgi:hypothetical protein
MAYLGSQPAVGNFVKLDDISTSFNGNTSTFNTTVSGQAYTVSNPYATLCVLGGELKNPGIDYYFQNATIVFATAPLSVYLGNTFVIALGDILTSGEPSDGTITNAKLAEGTVGYSKFASTTKATLLANSLLFGA